MSVPTGVDEKGKAEAEAMMKFLVENGAYWATSGQVPALKAVQALPEVQAIPSVPLSTPVPSSRPPEK